MYVRRLIIWYARYPQSGPLAIIMAPYLVVTVEAVEAVPATEGFFEVLFIED